MAEQSKIMVFVYGTLKEGGRLHPHMESIGAEKVGVGRLLNKAWVMRDLGSYPALQPVEDGSGTYILGEVYLIPTSKLAALDLVEGYPDGYDRKSTTVWVGDQSVSATVYFMEEGDNYHKSWITRYPIIQSGEWNARENMPADYDGNNPRPRGATEDCTECGYWMVAGECAQCGAVKTEHYDDTYAPYEDDEPRYMGSDFTVEGGFYVHTEYGEAWGPFDSLDEALSNLGEIATTISDEVGEDVRSVTIGFRVVRNNLTEGEREYVKNLTRE